MWNFDEDTVIFGMSTYNNKIYWYDTQSVKIWCEDETLQRVSKYKNVSFYFPHPTQNIWRKYLVSFIEKGMSVRGNDNSKKLLLTTDMHEIYLYEDIFLTKF